MSTTDYIVDIALILVIFWQVRPRELTAGAVILPLAIIAYAGFHYLHRFTVAGNDVLMAFAEVLARVAIMQWRRIHARETTIPWAMAAQGS
jgi:hypothetical protein